MKVPNPSIEPDTPPTPEEQGQAEALARALETDEQPAALVDMLETAALLRQAHEGRGTDANRALERALPALAARRKPRRWWLLPAILVPATAVIALGILPMQSRAPVRPSVMVESRPAPPPSIDL